MFRNLLAAITLAVLAPAAHASVVLTDPITYLFAPFQIEVTTAKSPFTFYNGTYSVSGGVTTDGTIGVLTEANILSANATAATGAGPISATFNSSNPGTELEFFNVTVEATVEGELKISWTDTGGFIEYGDGNFTAGFKQGSIIGFFDDKRSLVFDDPIESDPLFLGNSATIATSVAVPLPASLPILGGAVALLAALRRPKAA